MSTRRRSEPAWARRALATAIVFASAVAPCAARAQSDPLDAYRETFRRGMDRYKAGAIAEAIPYWENVYRELGPAKGYRVAFNLARAYDALGDSTLAAERLGAFIAEVEARRAAGEALEPVVLREEVDARARLGELAATRGRLRVLAAAQIDALDARAGAVVYVAPGPHVVTFGVGTPDVERRAIEARAGELVEVAPSPRAPAVPSARIAPPLPPSPSSPSSPSSPPPPSRPAAIAATATVTERPFTPLVLYAAAGVTFAGGVLTAVTYANALVDREAHDRAGTSPAARADIEASYPRARITAYAALGGTVTAAAATAVLLGVYFAGARTRVVPVAALTPSGAVLGVGGRF